MAQRGRPRKNPLDAPPAISDEGVREAVSFPPAVPESVQTDTSAPDSSPVASLTPAEIAQLAALERMCRKPSGPYPNPAQMRRLAELRKRK